MSSLGKVLIVSGIILVAAGLLISFAGNKLGWFGNLPGDINIKKDNFRFYAPVTSSFRPDRF